jgi:DNA-directed RNA polymerase III subunit RPC4
MKSGKIKIKMGDIYFDINQGNTAKFAQYSTIIVGDEEKQAYILGKPYNSKLIVTPEFD